MDEVYSIEPLDATPDPALLIKSVLKVAPHAITVLKAIRKKNEITGFEFIPIDVITGNDSNGKIQPGQFPLNKTNNPLHSKMVLVVETGKAFSTISSRELKGKLRWFLEKYSRQGECIIVHAEDVTEQKKAEDLRAQDNHFINKVAELSPDIIYITDLNTFQLVYTNRSVAIYLGYKKAEIAAMKNPLFDIMHEEDIPRMREHLKKIKSLKQNENIADIEYRLKNANGSYNWFCDRDAVFKRNDNKLPVEKIGICQDITERKELEEQKHVILNIVKQAEAIAQLGAWEYDLQTKEFKWTEGMYRLFNLHGDEQVRPEIYHDYSPDSEKEKINRVVEQIIGGQGPFEETIILLIPDQDSKTVRIKAVVQYDKKGNPSKVIGVDMDITAQAEALKEINELNILLEKKNQAWNELDHELRLFNKVAMRDYRESFRQLYIHLETITKNDASKLSDSGRANIRRAQSSVQRMNLMTDDLNHYFRLHEQDFQMEWLDSKKVLEEVIATYQKKFQQFGGTILSSELPRLWSNSELFTMLLSNLFSNSIKFRNQAHTLSIEVKYSRADALNSLDDTSKKTTYDILSVSDNGQGFDENDLEKLFELFYHSSVKNSPRGNGIGLAICRKIMTMHGGFITAEGKLNIGATFNCYFPVKK